MDDAPRLKAARRAPRAAAIDVAMVDQESLDAIMVRLTQILAWFVLAFGLVGTVGAFSPDGVLGVWERLRASGLRFYENRELMLSFGLAALAQLWLTFFQSSQRPPRGWLSAMLRGNFTVISRKKAYFGHVLIDAVLNYLGYASLLLPLWSAFLVRMFPTVFVPFGQADADPVRVAMTMATVYGVFAFGCLQVAIWPDSRLVRRKQVA